MIGPHNLGLQGNLLRSMKDTDENTSKRRKLFVGTVTNGDRESTGASDEETTKEYEARKNGDAGWKRKLEK